MFYVHCREYTRERSIFNPKVLLSTPRLLALCRPALERVHLDVLILHALFAFVSNLDLNLEQHRILFGQREYVYLRRGFEGPVSTSRIYKPDA